MAIAKWDIDRAHSTISFSVRHMLISRVRGRFTRWSGYINLDDETPAGSSVRIRIDASSVDTSVPDRDAHLRSPDFLYVERFPEVTFMSKNVERAGDRRYVVTGELAIRGVPQEVALDVRETGRGKDPWGALRIGFNAKVSLDRRTYGLRWNQPVDNGVLVGDRVDIDILIEAIRAPVAVKAA